VDRCPHCGRVPDDSDLPFVERLLKTLRHPEPTRVGLAIDILADRLHEPRAIAPLIDLLAESEDAAVLRQAARGLGWLGDARAVPPLGRILADAEAPYVVRSEAASSLGKIGGKAAEEALRRALADPRPSVSQAARQALGSMVSHRRLR